MPKHLGEALAEAQRKKRSGWRQGGTVEISTPGQAKNLPRQAQAVPTRSVIAGKGKAMRTPENKLPVLLKARPVVLGNLERDAKFCRDAPMGSLLAQHMALAWVASGGGSVRGPRRRLRKMEAKNERTLAERRDR